MTFYRRNDGNLLWLFRELDPSAFRLAEDDIFYANNRNAFRVTEAAIARSVRDHRFSLECVWHEPALIGSRLQDAFRTALVYFDELTLDVSTLGVPRAYYFDYDGAVQSLERGQREREQAVEDQSLRDALESLMTAFPRDWDAHEHRWPTVRSALRRRGFTLPDQLFDKTGPFYFLTAAYSAKRGAVTGSKMSNFSALANNLFTRHKGCLWVFSLTMRHYDRAEQMLEHGDKAGWKQRVRTYKIAWRERDPAFAPDHRFDALLGFLFPDVPAESWGGPP